MCYADGLSLLEDMGSMSRVGGLNAEYAFYIWVEDLSRDLFFS
jgi:hypothetical protein